MDDRRIGRALVVLRQRRGWRQADLAARAGVSQSAISDMERGRVGRYTLTTIRHTFHALDASADLDVNWGGRGQVDRLLDSDHARLEQRWATLHGRAGWELWSEASFSIYGERGRIDLLGYHAPTRTLEVVECKTGLWDVQECLGRLDAKVRLAPQVVAGRGWEIDRVVGALVFMDGTTVRRRVKEHDVLFARFALRGRAALAWVREPQIRTNPSGLLVFISLPRTNHGGLRRAGQRRVRLSATAPSVATESTST